MQWFYYLSLLFFLLSSSLKGATDGDFSTLALYSYAQASPPLPSFAYPYHGLATRLAAEGKTKLPLFSYGSLIDERSASRTLSPQALATRHPALAFGVIRTFNRDVPIKPESQWGIPCNAAARGMLNVQPTEQLENFINGVLIDVPLQDIEALLTREEGYDLIPVIVADWQALLAGNPQFTRAYILYARSGSSYVNENILPRPGYYELTRNAAKQFGPLFGLLWYNTTFMADGKTPIAVWEQWLQQDDPRTCVTTKQP